MELLHGAAVLLLSVFAYSAGHAAAARAEHPRPSPVDVVLAPAVAVALLLAALHLPKWVGLPLAVGAGLVAGLCVRALADALAPSSRGEERTPAEPGAGDEPAWRRYLFRVGDFQGRLVLALVYFVVVTPFALVVRFGQDPLQLRSSAGNPHTYWQGTEDPRGGRDPTRLY